ncbi:RCC1 domain-containing protein [Pseudomonas asplenii]|uniref:RCC1 domain-containing protein n=1 Tax=Pseudomonas asplenii TaxID=53407 RepID=UPI000382AC34|nr:hypothetical protein [Pseudomonas fuscovaginae]
MADAKHPHPLPNGIPTQDISDLMPLKVPVAIAMEDDDHYFQIPLAAQYEDLEVVIEQVWDNYEGSTGDQTHIDYFFDGVFVFRKTLVWPFDPSVAFPYSAYIPKSFLRATGVQRLTYIVVLDGNDSPPSQPTAIDLDRVAPNNGSPWRRLGFPVDEVTEDYLADPANNDQLVGTVERWVDIKIKDSVCGFWEPSANPAPEPVHIATLTIDRDHVFNQKPIELVFKGTDIRGKGNGEFRVYYKLWDKVGNDGPPSSGELIDVKLTPLPVTLLEPRVPLAELDGLIDLEDARQGVHMEILEIPGIQPGDFLDFYWDLQWLGEHQVEDIQSWPIPVPVSWEALSYRGAEDSRQLARVHYTWRRGNIGPRPSQSRFVDVDLTVAGPTNPDNPNPVNELLEKVTVKGVTGDNRITEADEASAPVRVVVPLYADPLPGQVLELMWAGEPAPVATYRVSAVDKEGDLVEFFIHWDLIEPIGNAKVQASYWTYNGVNRQRSPSTEVEVSVGVLTITGNRTQVGPHYYNNLSRLVATVKGAGTPYWRYEGQTDAFKGPAFLDSHPELELSVGLEPPGKRQEQVLRRVNVTGVYNVDSSHAGCITLDDGSLYGWSDNPALLPPTGLAAVRHVVGGGSAFAALHHDGSVSAWGRADLGGVAPRLTQVKRIVASSGAFVAVHVDGSLSAWGDPEHGGSLPDMITPLDQIEQIVGSSQDFCIRRMNGAVFSWGRQWPNGQRLFEAQSATQIVASKHAFAAIKPDRTVLAWGDPEYGGQIPASLEGLLTDIVLLVSTSRAFAALAANGQVYAWGNPGSGGQAPGGLDGITHVLGSTHAFAAVDAAGQVTVWGEPAEGGTRPSDLEAVLSLSAANASLAAVQRNQMAISWGQIAARPGQANVAGIYAAGNHLVLLTHQSTARAWGTAAPGLAHLDGSVSYRR